MYYLFFYFLKDVWWVMLKFVHCMTLALTGTHLSKLISIIFWPSTLILLWSIFYLFFKNGEISNFKSYKATRPCEHVFFFFFFRMLFINIPYHLTNYFVDFYSHYSPGKRPTLECFPPNSNLFLILVLLTFVHREVHGWEIKKFHAKGHIWWE